MARRTRKAANQAKRRLIGYIRVSTTEQATEGVSLDAQRSRLEAYALAHDFDLIGVETDEGISGAKSPARRPGLSKAIARLEGSEADGLLVLKLDRFSRKTKDVIEFVDETNRKGWSLISVNESLDTETAAGRLVLTVLAALAEMEREQIGERVIEAMDHIAREGRARSRRIPFGMQTADGGTEIQKGDKRTLIENAEEQKMLKVIVRARKQGQGPRKIARLMNDKRLVNPRTGHEWTPSAMQSLIRNYENRQLAFSA